MALIDDVIDRRNEFDKIEAATIKTLQDQVNELRSKANDSLASLVKQYAEDGEFQNGPAALRAAKAKVDALTAALGRVTAKASTKLKADKADAYDRAAMDMQFAVDNATDGVDSPTLAGDWNQVPDAVAVRSLQQPILGVKPGKEFEGLKRATERRLQELFSHAILSGESVERTSEKLSEALDINERAATRIARTNMSAAWNAGHKDWIDQNDDVFDGYVWDSTMDGRTSLICATLHGRVFGLDEEPPGPPAHPNCRSVLLPRFKDPEVQAFVDAGERRVRNLTADGERSKKTTVVKNDMTFEEWLRKQPASASQKITGSQVKDTLWRSGAVDFEELLAPDLTARTDAEVVQRAVTHSPKDKELKALAKQFDVKASSDAALARADSKLAKQQEFDVGISMDEARQQVESALEDARVELAKAKAAAKAKLKRKKP